MEFSQIIFTIGISIATTISTISYGYGKLTSKIESINENGGSFAQKKLGEISEEVASLKTSQAVSGTKIDQVLIMMKELKEELKSATLHGNRSSRTS